MDIVFFDIDGTLDDDRGVVPASAAEAVRMARANGVFCAINTGRPYSHIVPQVRAIGFDAYVCSIGQHIIVNGNTLVRRRPGAREASCCAAAARDCLLDAYYESEEGLCAELSGPLSPYMKAQLDEFERRGLPVLYGWPEEGFRFDKFCVWEREQSRIHEFFRAVSELFYPIARGGGMFEMVMNGCSKASGMRELIAHVKDSRGESPITTYAIGDSPNDETMLKNVDHPIAMGGAPQSVARLCEFVTTDIHKDGVKNALAHFGLI